MVSITKKLGTELVKLTKIKLQAPIKISQRFTVYHISRKMCVENATCDTKIRKIILKAFEEKLNIKEISNNKRKIITF